MGGGESGVMCWKFSEVEKIECIFSIFFCKELHKSVSQKLRGFIEGRIFVGILCNTSPRTRHNFCGLW